PACIVLRASPAQRDECRSHSCGYAERQDEAAVARRTFGIAHMLRTHTDSDCVAQRTMDARYARRELELPRRLQRPRIREHMLESCVRSPLRSLRQARRKFAAALPPSERLLGYVAAPQRGSEQISCRHRVLYRQIDPDTARRRHRVGRVADAQQPRTM